MTIKNIPGRHSISRDTINALHKMGTSVHTNHYMGAHQSVFAECPCTKCG